MIVWHLYWHGGAQSRDETYLFETQEDAIEYALQTRGARQYIEGDTAAENARACLIKGQYPDGNCAMFCGAYYFTLRAIPITKKVNGEWQNV
jgi:hypothetical protein